MICLATYSANEGRALERSLGKRSLVFFFPCPYHREVKVQSHTAASLGGNHFSVLSGADDAKHGGLNIVLHVRLYCISMADDDMDDVDLKHAYITDVMCSVVNTVSCTLSHRHIVQRRHACCPLWRACSSGVVLADKDHQRCNPPYSAARLINGLCQRQCQSIGCSFWVCRGVGEELCILRRSAQWLAKSWLYWFLSSLLFVKISNCRP